MFCFQQQASQTPTLTPEWTQTHQKDELQVWTPGRRSLNRRLRSRPGDVPAKTSPSGGLARGRLLVLVSRETDTNQQA